MAGYSTNCTKISFSTWGKSIKKYQHFQATFASKKPKREDLHQCAANNLLHEETDTEASSNSGNIYLSVTISGTNIVVY